MTQECILTGRITRLAIFRVPEFGTRASFQLPERPPQSARWPAMSRENSLPTIAKGPRGRAWFSRTSAVNRGLGIALLRLGDDAEPSLMMPGIIISLIFSEQGKLVLRATALLASALEVANNLANGFGIQITAANFPRCTRSYLFAL